MVAPIDTLSVVDCGLEPMSGLTKNCIICISCFSDKLAILGVRKKTGSLRISIMCPSGAACLSTECCFNELGLCKSNSACWSSTKHTSS